MKLLKGMLVAIASVMLILTGCEKDEVVPVANVKVEQTEEKTALKDEQPSQEESKETKEQAESNDKADEKKADDSEHTTTENEEKNTAESKAPSTEKNEEKQAEEPAKKTAEQNPNTNTSVTKQHTAPEKESATAESKGQQKEPVKESNQEAVTTKQSQPNIVKEATAPKPKETQPATVKEQPPAAQPKKEEVNQTVTVSIVGEGTILSATKVEISEGNTVLDATLTILKQKGIPISVRGGGSGAYVEGINNLYEFDRGPLSGWEVKRNGAKIDRSAGAIKVGNGDTIQWVYTTDYKGDANE